VLDYYEEAQTILQALFDHAKYMIMRTIEEMDSQMLPRAPIRLEVELAD